MNLQNKPGVEFQEIRNKNSPWRAVLHLANRHVLPKGSRVPLGNALYFMERGKGRLAQQNPELREKIFWYIQEGCLFGEVPYLQSPPKAGYTYFLCCADSIVYSFSAQSLATVCAEHPDLLLNLIKSMAHKIRVLVRQLAAIHLDNLSVRICKFLAQRLVPGSQPLMAKVAISRQEMASLLGVNRITLYKTLRSLEESGLLGPFVNNRVSILQPEKFFAMLES